MPAPSAAHIDIVPFELDGLADLARAASPELATQVNSELGTPPAPKTPEELAAEAEAAAGAEGTPAPEAGEAAAAEGAAGDTGTDEEALTELNRQSEEAKKKADDEAAAAKEKEAAEKAAAEATATAAKAATVPTDDRDKDLKLDERHTATLNPRTRKVIEERNAKIVEARNRATALEKERTELTTKLAAAEEAAKKTAIPKAVEDELTNLRQRVRELDITHDPQLVAKYDAPVQANRDKMVALLQEFGLGKIEGGGTDQGAIDKIKASPMDFRTMSTYITKLTEKGAEDAAEELREILRDNIRLGREKQQEITTWKTQFDLKQSERQQTAQKGQEQLVADIRTHADRVLKTDIETLSKDFPYLNRPPAPLPTDAAPIAKAKADAIAAYDAAGQAIATAVKQFDSAGAKPEQLAEIHGRLSASAVEGIIIRQRILPEVVKELTSLRARNAELEKQMGAFKKAGSLSRAHAAAAQTPAGAKAPLPENTEDAARQIAKEFGIDPNS